MFDPFERVARAHHVCPCCERPFSAEEEDDFVKKVGISLAMLSSCLSMNLLLRIFSFRYFIALMLLTLLAFGNYSNE